MVFLNTYSKTLWIDRIKLCCAKFYFFHACCIHKNGPKLIEIRMMQFRRKLWWDHSQSSYILRRPENFAKSSPYFWLALHRTKVRERFRKILWPSQSIWTLQKVGKLHFRFLFNELKLILAIAFRNSISGVTQLNYQITYSLVWVRDTLDIWPQTSAETAQVIT